MIIKSFNKQEINKRLRVTAEIYWEDNDWESKEIYIEVDKQFSDFVSDGVDAIFVATVIPALHYGEKEIKIDGEVCPFLHQGIEDVLSWFYSWYYQDKRPPLKLNIKTRAQESVDNVDRYSASFFTAGIDSFQTLIDNRTIFSESHPGYIEYGIIAFGLNIDDTEKFRIFEHKIRKSAKKVNLSLITIYTNIYLIYRELDAKNDFSFWKLQFQGAALASIAHFLSRKIHTINIAATYDLLNLEPFGSHPLIDPNYSSNNLKVHHRGLRYSRLEKMKFLIEYLPLLRDINVCNQFEKFDESFINCGECEKCTRTMLELIALGKLKETSVFPYKDVTPDMIISNQPEDEYDKFCYSELLKPLEKAGRPDLVSVVRYIISRYDNRKKFFRSFLTKIDYHFMHGWFSEKLNG